MSRTWAINSKLGFHSCIKAEHHKIRADYFEQRRWISFSVSSKLFSAVNLRRVNLQLLGGLGVVKKTKPGSLRPWAEAAPHARSAKLLLLLWDQWRPVRSSFWWMWNYFYLLLSVRGGGSESCRGYSVKIHQQKSCNRLPLHNHTARDFTNVRLVG